MGTVIVGAGSKKDRRTILYNMSGKYKQLVRVKPCVTMTATPIGNYL